MIFNRILVLGGAGFVGCEIVERLAARGLRVRVPTRIRERAKRSLIVLPTVEVVDADIHDAVQLDALATGCDAVINLVGVLHNGRGNDSFATAHVELTRKVIEACKRRGIRRLLHMSALAATTDAPSQYLRTKAEAEALVTASGLDWTVFRPSLIFGPGRCFATLFAQMLKFVPVVALACPDARFQPVWVGDVARAFVDSLGNLASFAKRYELGGPKVYSLRELVAFIGQATGHARPIVGLGNTLSNLQAAVLELSPVKILTRDNVRSMQVPSVCAEPWPFAWAPAAFEGEAGAFLSEHTPRARYRGYRSHAGREI
jgi:NADH dehydrogenase